MPLRLHGCSVTQTRVPVYRSKVMPAAAPLADKG
jgi:hypothetical protein